MSDPGSILGTQPLIYIDTSVYLCLLLGEKLSSQIEKSLQDQALCSCSILALEAERNLVRLSREKIISEKDFPILQERLKSDLDIFVFKDLDLNLCGNGIFPAVKTPRSSDLAHLRTALWFQQHEKLGGFFTLDQHQQEAARELRLPIFLGLSLS